MAYIDIVHEINRREVVRRRNLQNSRIVCQIAGWLGNAPHIAHALEDDKLEPILAQADEMIEAFGYELADTRNESRKIESTASSQLAIEFLIYKITPWAEQTREKLFHSKQAPFKTKEEASKWIEDVYTREHERHDAYRQKLDEDKRELEKLRDYYSLGEFNKVLQQGPTPSKYEPRFKLPEFERSAEVVFVDEAEEIGRMIGQSFYPVVLYVLAGSKTGFRRFHVYTKEVVGKIPFGERVVNRVAKIEIRDALSFDELRSLYNAIRSKLGASRMKALNERHLKLFQIVRDKGGPARGEDSVRFWKEVREDWGNEECQTWRGTRRAYFRLEEKLNKWYVKGG